MSDKKQFAVVMLVSALFVAWILYRSLSVVLINEQLQADPELRDYPYPFRVLTTEGRVAVMGTIRAHEVPRLVALRALHPELKDLPADNPELLSAERRMIRLQARAQEIVLQSNDFEQVRWELDENWLRLNGVQYQTYSHTRLTPPL